jgi:hypothetical protein
MVHLISDDSTDSTGVDFMVDGGETATSRLSESPQSDGRPCWYCRHPPAAPSSVANLSAPGSPLDVSMY